MTLRFQPPLWAWGAYLPLLALLLALGGWQASRGLTKQTLDADAAAPLEMRPWNPDLAPRITPPLQVTVNGRYRDAPVLLLDNQSYQRRPGLHVWSVFEPAEGPLVMVSRGWVPWHGGRAQLPDLLPTPDDTVVTGLWRPLPRPGLTLLQPPCAPGTDGPQLVNYPQVDTLRCLLQAPVADGIILLPPDPERAEVRQWSLTEAVPATRHFGYAAQWFMFAAVLSFFFVRMNLRKPQ
jgi:surfeit locus 1 family protein